MFLKSQVYSSTSRIDFMNAGGQYKDTNTCNIVWHRVSNIVKANLSGLLFAVMVVTRPLQMRLWFPILHPPPPESTVLFDHYGIIIILTIQNILQCHQCMMSTSTQYSRLV